ncbi:ABC transporter permease [Sandaracinobacteroides saxicola]|uniref:FtsX-like permease family protein n=1 Tax=Sandaracinobacteroides saxicola TaxID=2759707 RepID=A0A7G5IKI7_9SPHN|nr:ABC transporter permease [Sandaracinobacteroides saxicola]QMW23879.1 FtsX-like permease family protein [Sandaracinobacteroides saxicola]
MPWIALRMLTGDRVKYFGLIFGIAFSTLLIAQQATLFTNLMLRAAAGVFDVSTADIWVMDAKAVNTEGTLALPATDLFRVRGVPGVAWAVPHLREGGSVRTPEGRLERVSVIGVDDATLTGLPSRMVEGVREGLFEPGAILVDPIGFKKIFPGEGPKVGRELELNDRRAVVKGIVDGAPTFTAGVLFYTRYSQALDFVPGTRNRMTFVLAKAKAGEDAAAVARRIEAVTGLKARTRNEWAWDNILYVATSTGIPINFGITVLLGLIVGIAIVGLTFSLFIRDNIKQFGALKAIGVTNGAIRGMVLTQALWIAAIGFGIGAGLTALFISGSSNSDAFKGFYLPWEIMAGTGVVVFIMVILTGFVAIRGVLKLEPAEVFR